MCRFLIVKGKGEFKVKPFLEKFARACRENKIFQGDGWGLALFRGNNFLLYKNIKPIWEDRLDWFDKADFLVAHARSAFEEGDLRIEANIPFKQKDILFVFNGELRKVRIAEKGCSGAEKLFNFVRKFIDQSPEEGIKKAIEIIKRKTALIKALNFAFILKKRIYLYSYFSQQREYFSLKFFREGKFTVICSEKIFPEIEWLEIKNDSLEVF